MINLRFSSAEMRFATGALATIAALAPTIYFLLPTKKQDSTEHVKTFNKLIRSYATQRSEALTSTATRNFTHIILPVSLDLSPRSVATFKNHAEEIFSMFENFEMTPQRNGKGNAVHFSPETDLVTAHCRMGGKLNASSEKGQRLISSGLTEWWTECVLFVRMSSNGKRIVEVREFVDSARAEELQRRLSNVLSN